MTILEVFNKVKDLYKLHNLYNEKVYINDITNHNFVRNIFYDSHSCILVFESNNIFRPEFIEDVLRDCSNFYSKYGKVDTNIKDISIVKDKIIFTLYE